MIASLPAGEGVSELHQRAEYQTGQSAQRAIGD